MLETLRKKLKEEGRSYSWWITKYLHGYKYHTIMSQINGFTDAQDYLFEAIEKYLKEN